MSISRSRAQYRCRKIEYAVSCTTSTIFAHLHSMTVAALTRRQAEKIARRHFDRVYGAGMYRIIKSPDGRRMII